jgi:hypothetical protein
MMRSLPVILVVLALAVCRPAAGAPADKPFRTEVAPRIDPVFGDAASLRESIDQFAALQGEMESVRDEFSAAVHAALAQMGPIGSAPPTTCPAGIAPVYDSASAVGRRYLALGRRMAAQFRDIRRAEELGDIVALTPDYRNRARKAHDLFQERVRDYREMRAAFYEQLTEEMRHAGCKLSPAAPAAAADKRPDSAAVDRTGPDPANPKSWELEPQDETTTAPGAKAGGRSGTAGEMADGEAPAVWIQIDNSHCAQPSALTIDGAAVGNIAARKKIAVRAHAGPHELCVMPGDDKRTCGAPGTLRRAYLHEGWTLVVRCGD